MSISHVSGCAMMSVLNTGYSKGHIRFFVQYPVLYDERETSGYKYRVVPGTAITGNGVKDTPVRS